MRLDLASRMPREATRTHRLPHAPHAHPPCFPTSQLRRAADHTRRTSLAQAAALQAAAAWQAHSGRISAAGALGAAYALHRLALLPALRLASELPNTHPALAAGASAAASLALVAGVASYAAVRAAVDPDRVYRLAMLKLNSDPGILEVMGAPLAGERAPGSGGGRRAAAAGVGQRLHADRLPAAGAACTPAAPVSHLYRGVERATPLPSLFVRQAAA
jgi:hypothetical protein